MPSAPAFDAPLGGGGSRQNIAMTFDTEKLRVVWLPDGEKIQLYLVPFFSYLTLNNIVTLKSWLDVTQDYSPSRNCRRPFILALLGQSSETVSLMTLHRFHRCQFSERN